MLKKNNWEIGKIWKSEIKKDCKIKLQSKELCDEENLLPIIKIELKTK